MYMSVLTPIEVPEGKKVLRILDNSGHTDLVYDPTVEAEVTEAMGKFDESMAKGMRAFALDGEGGGTVVRDFAETSPQTVISPQYVGG
jgi:hypothetical protein